MLKEFQAKVEHLEREKPLADKVTNELLSRIQRYEQELAEIRKEKGVLEEENRLKTQESKDLKLIE
jgi:hypothetical protein